MGKKERLQKEIDRLERYAKFYLSMLLAVLSGVTGVIYAILVHNIKNQFLIILGIMGAFLSIGIILKVKSLDKEENRLFEELEKEE